MKKPKRLTHKVVCFRFFWRREGVVLQRAHTKSKHFCRLLFAQACSMTRTKSVQGCTPLISATKIIKKQAERSTLLVFMVELKAAKTHTVLYQINRTEYYCQVDLPLSDYPRANGCHCVFIDPL